jgi:hypothetical protein
VTDILPLAPLPTLAVIRVAELITNEPAGVPPKVTEPAPLRLLPEMMIWEPQLPDTGEKELISGAGILAGREAPITGTEDTTGKSAITSVKSKLFMNFRDGLSPIIPQPFCANRRIR